MRRSVFFRSNASYYCQSGSSFLVSASIDFPLIFSRRVSPFSPPNRSLPEVHGHRGCRGLRPENTISAFLHALELGVDVLELDVVISADNQVVVSHEPWLNPAFCLDPEGNAISQGSAASFNLFRMPYALIQACDCGQRPNPDFPTQIAEPACKPLLHEVVARAEAAVARSGRAPVRYSIEIKSSPAGDGLYHPEPARFLALVMAEISVADVLTRTTLLCFDPRVLRLVHTLYPEVATCLLVEDGGPWLSSIEALGLVPTAFGPEFITVTPGAVKALRDAHPSLRLVPWTVNEPNEMRRLWTLGVDGITTDYPDRLLAVLAQ